MITFKHKGDFKSTEKLFENVKRKDYMKVLDALAKRGVAALADNTPKDTGKTSESWVYTIEKKSGTTSIVWSNTNVNNYVNIAVILQYGHATKNGGWVEGRDYINPAIQPIFDQIANEAWEEVIAK